MKDKSNTPKQAEASPATKSTTTAAPRAQTQSANTKKRSLAVPALVVLIVLMAAGGAYVYHQHNQQSEQYTAQLQGLAAQANQSDQAAKQALSQVENQSQQLKRLQQELARAQEQLKDVGSAVQTLSDAGTELMLLNDVEQLVTLAQQQLQIGGNVANAIISLEAAQSRLSHAHRQNFAVLIQTLNGDLERLRTAQTVDISTLGAQLERLSDLVTHASLYVPNQSQKSPQNASDSSQATENTPENAIDPDAQWWERGLEQGKRIAQNSWHTLKHDLSQFISVRRIDDSAALLISPDQADRLKEGLRLRITMAQLALLTKQPKVWQSELDFIIRALEQRFDPSTATTQRALALATQLADTHIEVKLPSLNNTLAAIENLKQSDESTESLDELNVAPQTEPDSNTASQPTAPKSSSQESSTKNSTDHSADKTSEQAA